ncbi:hypothetical protein KP509_39G026400 [Ceratopteris richardii]|uniref:Hexosyltransferase n=1 Tax=Ceratopteris richardii TaxID=49495 RepID=A0A8T2PZV0_CERRI|nr:hypothetical protein KP509_39G026400 [Ceratopteris richardii]
MRRRPGDPRRQQRKTLSRWSVWIVSGLLTLIAFALLVHYRRLPDLSSENQVATQSSLNLTEEMLSPGSLIRQLGDQITLGKAYVVIAKESSDLVLAWELSAQIRAAQQLLAKSAAQANPLEIEEVEHALQKFSMLLSEAKELHYDSAVMIMKLKVELLGLEEKVSIANIQSTAFGQLAAEAVPKGLYCLGNRLTMMWAIDPDFRSSIARHKLAKQIVDNDLFHICIFSDNVLAASVVINSTVLNANHPEQLVFHLVTDEVNFGAMQAWFCTNDFKGATIEVQNIESFTWLNASYVPVMRQLQDAAKFRNPRYLSMLNLLRFYIPEVYPALKKVVFLDDDVVVQRDLTDLFKLDLHGNVNGAVETCVQSFHRYHKYLNFSHPKIRENFNPDGCGWAFGMNVFDLTAWKSANVTSRYHYWQSQNADRTLWKLGTLPPGLLTFYGLTKPLDRNWHVLGLGYDPDVDVKMIEGGAVLHYNGNMKPWLKLAISRYKPLWERYVDFSHQLLQECNVH